MLIDLGVL